MAECFEHNNIIYGLIKDENFLISLETPRFPRRTLTHAVIVLTDDCKPYIAMRQNGSVNYGKL